MGWLLCLWDEDIEDTALQKVNNIDYYQWTLQCSFGGYKDAVQIHSTQYSCLCDRNSCERKGSFMLEKRFFN